jgi:hypothetical protein
LSESQFHNIFCDLEIRPIYVDSQIVHDFAFYYDATICDFIKDFQSDSRTLISHWIYATASATQHDTTRSYLDKPHMYNSKVKILF